MLKKTIIFVSFQLLILNSFAAEFIHDKTTECHGWITINGTINQGDAKIFANGLNQIINDYYKNNCNSKTFLPKNFKYFTNISLNSNGGSLEESMKIGELIREMGFFTSVGAKSECLSSCVFILAAGVRRDAYGAVGIHKPYFADLNEKLSISDIKNIRNQNINSMKRYFEIMDISESLVDAMLSVEPNKIKLLSSSELERYRLNVPDSNYDEKITAKKAHEFNLSSSDYRKKSIQVEVKCNTFMLNSDFINLFKCQHMIYLGISENEYNKRRSRALKTCENTKDEARTACMYEITILNK